MKRAEASQLGAHDWLLRASRAPDPESRAKYATRGLSLAGSDRSLQALLLRQLYVSHLEGNRLNLALATAEQLVELEALADIAYQDLARVQLGLGDCSSALKALDRAWDVAPPERRGFHDWTRGCLLYLLGDYASAVAAFHRGSTLSSRAPRLLEAQSVLAQFAAHRGDAAANPGDAQQLRERCERLEHSAAMSGYGAFIAGEARFLLGDAERARELLRTFVARLVAAPWARQVALGLELSRARERLRQLNHDSAS